MHRIATFVALASSAIGQTDAQRRAIVSVERIWDRAPHSAFTDLCEFRGSLYCAFREGSGHVPGTNGVVRILRSDDGLGWRPVARLDEQGVDLRDPKLSVTADGRLQITIGGSVYEGRDRVAMAPRVAFSQDGREFTAPIKALLHTSIASSHDWLWRVSWIGERGVGVLYQVEAEENRVWLVETEDGISYQPITMLQVTGKPNESTVRSIGDGTWAILMRREGGDRMGRVGIATSPFKEWRWRDLPVRLGGPNFVRLSSGTLLAGSRKYSESGAETALAILGTGGSWRELLTLPSGGDTSYPGLVLRGEHVLVSYYSSHEGESAIYLATLRRAALEELGGG